ncbi:MAG: hypothetical protein ACJAW2_000959, partial [Shewanella sp.]
NWGELVIDNIDLNENNLLILAGRHGEAKCRLGNCM